MQPGQVAFILVVGGLAIAPFVACQGSSTSKPDGGLTCYQCDYGADTSHAGGGGDIRCKDKWDWGNSVVCPEGTICYIQTSRVYGTTGPVYRGCMSEKAPLSSVSTSGKATEGESRENADENGRRCTVDVTDENIEITRCFCRDELCNGSNSPFKASNGFWMVVVALAVAAFTGY